MENKIQPLIPLSQVDLKEEDIQSVVEVLLTGMLVQGKKVEEAEIEIANYIKSSKACLVSNGTASLHLALVALGIGAGDEVILPAFSYVATANVVEIVGAKCKFVDIDLSTFNILANQIEGKISKSTKAIMPVHEFGLCADMTEIMRISKKHKIPVIEDAACAIGATHKGKAAGTFGEFGSFSFHPRKSITSGEGGCLVASDQKLDKKIRTLRNHGLNPDNLNFDFIEAGFNYRLTDFQAALLLGQLKRIEESLRIKANIAARYLNEIQNEVVILPFNTNENRHSWQTFHILLPTPNKRDRLARHLADNGIKTNIGAQCIPAMPYYKKKYGYDFWRAFPNAFHAYQCGLAIPIFSKLKEDQVSYIIQKINQFV